jgi:mono/diheme cytochrome c family protein
MKTLQGPLLESLPPGLRHRRAKFCLIGLLLHAHLRYELPDTQRKESQMQKQLTAQGLVLGLVFMGQSITYAADANQGKEMYVQYCSSCHGQDGRGSGSVSAFLKVKVPDLTLLTKKNKGIYPIDKVILAIDGRRKLRSHGDPKMPVWGESFSREVKDPKSAEAATGVKVKTIAEYVATLQR